MGIKLRSNWFEKLTVLTIVLLCVFFMAYNAHATDTSKTEVRVSINDGSSTVVDTGLIVDSFTSGTRQTSTVSLAASTFTALTIPSGAKGVLIDPGTTTNIRLKGVTGDTGISVDSAFPLLLPLSADGTANVGFQNLNATSKQINVTFF